MLFWRVIYGVSISASIIAICWADYAANCGQPGIWIFPLVMILAWLATDEVLSLQEGAGNRTTAWPVYLGVSLLVISAAVPMIANLLAVDPAALPTREAFDLIALAIGTGAVFYAQMRTYEKPEGVIARLTAGLFPIIYIGITASFILRLRLIGGSEEALINNGRGLIAFLSLCFTVKLSDIGAYTFGHMMGRHKLVPKLSPGKTVEGAIGGVIVGCLGAWFSCNVLGWFLLGEAATPAPWWSWMLFGIVVTIAGMMGDLAESLLKRSASRKDSSHWLRGLGGVLDILDSLLFAAPVAYCFWAFGWITA